MIAETLGSLLLYSALAIAPGWLVASRLTCAPAEKLLASVALSLLGVFLVGWSIYLLGLPRAAFWLSPAISLAAAAIGWRSFLELCRDSDTRVIVWSQIIVTSWCVGWLALVVTYSGGAWVGDWFGHWQRAMFFLERGPHDILFNGFDPLTSRPPFANIVFGAFMAVTRIDFAHYQLATTFLASLVFLPAALLARRFGGARSIPLLTLLFLCSPMLVQNATFAWTKLHAAFFVLTASYFFLRTQDDDTSSTPLMAGITMAAALLTHYSAGPYAVVVGLAWIVQGWWHRREPKWWRQPMLAVLASGALLATWFAWALTVYGAKGTFLTNTSVTDKASSAGAQLWIAILNVRDTLVPHFLREVDYGFIAQSSPWGWWRDWLFLLYQINFFLAFGSVAWLIIAVLILRQARTVTWTQWAGWAAGLGSLVVLGIVVHAGRDGWGLAHICLQPVVLGGIAFLAARWDSLGRGLRRIVISGALLDLALGIALQFGAESFLLDQWLAPHHSLTETLSSYSAHSAVNLRAKLHFRFVFFGDGFLGKEPIILVLLGTLLLLALIHARRKAAPSSNPT